MELVKKNIHTEQIKAKTVLQIPLEEDINVSDSKPDVARIIHSGGRIKTDEIKMGMNKIWVKGRLEYQIMYQADGGGADISGMDGELPFMEEVYLDRLEGQDRVICKAQLDDLRIHIINSRKLSIQSVISLEPRVEETVSAELCVGIDGLEAGGPESGIQYREKTIDYLETAVKKRDLLRIHEEVKLPAGMPDMGAYIWKSIDVANISFRAADEKLVVNGEINVFVVYREDNSDKINWYETTVPFSGNVECQNSRDGMLADVSYDIGQEEITIRDDSDGEARIIGIEMALELEIKLYEKQQLKVIADVYGVSCDVNTETDDKNLCCLLTELKTEDKLMRSIKLEDAENRILQVCHCDAHVISEDVVFEENKVIITGTTEVKLLYTSSAESPVIYSVSESIPFELVMDSDGACLKDTDRYTLNVQLLQQSVSIRDGAQLEWRAVLNACILMYENKSEAVINDLRLSPIPAETLEALPGFAVYCVKNGDSLWQIGRKYYVSVERIKEINNLDNDMIKEGDRLLIVK